MKKSHEKIVADNMWGSAALFVCASFITFLFIRTEGARTAGWALYWCGWIAPSIMAIWCLAKRQNPGIGGIFSFTLLALSGFLFWLNHG
ncbi:hypothetical protein [Streptomyces lincolnensis]|uniref:hypothetical protein n=1 Tax=Streptomyces lincolnensis TaxID=1915 RepID=UPI00082EBBC3|nr:hypothetical protein [Streptomyces lincolnensis]QMV07838.1 hypothetical protein GJU35_20630 [Streptomyces lincolnensis]